jgi:hypothetical protein
MREGGTNSSDKYGNFPVMQALMNRLLPDSCRLWIFNFIGLPCLLVFQLSCHEISLHSTHFGITARMFFRTEDNQ